MQQRSGGKRQTREMGTQTVRSVGLGVGEGEERSRDSVEGEGEMEMRVGSPSRNFSRIIPSPPPPAVSSRGKQREPGAGGTTTFAGDLDGFESARWRMESSFSPTQGRRGGERRERYRFLDQRIPSGDLHAL